ncbi:hypothetical protein LG296_20855 (plasmid) [Ureibacillus chungkukjangi]|uniref:hypothetical protein n=1 Tax=Ureibacillus chungkukjangi TaxID=1202712 RepID=UPI00187D64E0|nr:hypothetical protein [Ureibacillus chungkukjangi]MCM3390005.1 hypothetical protein [Ureibacillus chungkukjangi]
MATITIKVRNGKALVTDNPTRNKVVIINYDILTKQVENHFYMLEKIVKTSRI